MEGYSSRDISSEEWREVVYLETGAVYRIKDPVTLITRSGGTTHRVVDKDGVVHCYPAPEHSVVVLRWKAREGQPPVAF